MSLSEGYREFFDKAKDPALAASKNKDGMFFIFHSIEAWKKEECKDEDIPKKALILSELKRNRFLAHP